MVNRSEKQGHRINITSLYALQHAGPTPIPTAPAQEEWEDAKEGQKKAPACVCGDTASDL